MMDPAEDLDGRRQRAVRSRGSVVDAMLDLLRELDELPSAQAIADRAGVSLRTVFRLFDDVDTLLATAVAHQIDRVGLMFSPLEISDTLDRRIDALALQRERLFEEIGPVRRAAMRRTEHAAIREWLDRSHLLLRRQLTTLFAQELRARTGPQRLITTEALDAAAGFGTWSSLRIEQHLDPATARGVMAHSLSRLLR